MRTFYILSFLSAVSAFNLNFFPAVFQRHKRQACTVYTVIQYPCAVETWVPSNTVLWIDACTTTLNISNAPTSLRTTITSTKTLGIPTPSTSTKTVRLPLQTTSTRSTTATLSGTEQTSTSTSSDTATANSITLSCVPSSTVYPDPINIPANTTYLIQVTSPGLNLQSNGTPLYLTRTGALTSTTSLGIHIFFYENLLFALDTVFGVGWYATSTSPSTDKSIFALEQYEMNPTDVIARNFEGTQDANEKLSLRWRNCVFGNGNANGEVVWARDVKDGMVYSWFRGVPGPVQDVEVVELLLVTAGVAIEPSTTLLGEAKSTAMLAATTTAKTTSVAYV